MNTTINKNHKAYDSGDVSVFINGMPINVQEISYGTEQEHQVNYTLGNRPSSWSRGKISYSGSMTLLMNDAAELEEAAGGDLLSIKPFEINVTFVNEFNKIINDTITALFSSQGREITGDMGLNRQYELCVLNIRYNNV